jgi:uncharacterized membrane protein YfcA
VNWRLVIPMTAAVLVIWVVGAAVTKYSLEQMAYLAPIAVVVVGVQIGLVMLWVKVIRQSRLERRSRDLEVGNLRFPCDPSLPCGRSRCPVAQVS